MDEIKKFNTFVEEKIKESGYEPPKPVEFNIKATVKFQLDEDLASKLASDIKIEYIPGSNYIGLGTYKQIVDSSFTLIRK